MGRPASVNVFVTRAGNEFMVDIARAYVEGFRLDGVVAELMIDAAPGLESHNALQLVVAPHEFFPLYLERRAEASVVDRIVRAVYVLNVEQPGSTWFELACRYAADSRAAFDVSEDGTLELGRRGIDATWAPLGALVDPSATVPVMADRPIDVVFLGHASVRRQRFFSEHADTFARCHCRLHFVDVTLPRQASTPGYCSGANRSELLTRTKILLNVHAFEGAYFERHRAALAIEHGCVLVTESSRGMDPLVDGVHLVAAPIAELPRRCEELLRQPDRLDAMAAAGRTVAAAGFSMRRATSAILTRADRPAAAAGTSLAERREVIRSRIAQSEAQRISTGPDWTVERIGSDVAGAPPRVSVVVTVHDYEQYLRQCLESVFASDPVPGGMEVVVVDDASSDGSVEVARTASHNRPVAASLVLKQSNTGLADARNVGIQEARGEFVLTLDADNWVYPQCVGALLDALVDSPHAAAYPILRCVRSPGDESIGLLSTQAWSVERLVRAPYIDALALFRRRAVLDVGGYSTDLFEHGWFGWEDYDLWLKLAAAGWSCVQVPRILASYRVHHASMIGTTNRVAGSMTTYLQGKFRSLAARQGNLDMYFGAPVDRSSTIDPRAIADVRDYCRSLERRIAELEGSLSWRVTRPIRAALTAIRRRGKN